MKLLVRSFYILVEHGVVNRLKNSKVERFILLFSLSMNQNLGKSIVFMFRALPFSQFFPVAHIELIPLASDCPSFINYFFQIS